MRGCRLRGPGPAIFPALDERAGDLLLGPVGVGLLLVAGVPGLTVSDA
jgi:hypothetical protein